MKAAVFIKEIITYEILIETSDVQEAEKIAWRGFNSSKEGFKIIEHDCKLDGIVDIEAD